MATEYVRPKGTPSDMGGDGVVLDGRLAEVQKLLGYAPLDGVSTLLDIGAGKCQLSRWFAEKGIRVTATGLELESYEIDKEDLQTRLGIELVECPAQDMPFPDEHFDAVLMSHVLEHCPNVGAALAEVRRVLITGGWLFVFVPPSNDGVSAGHISVGWNIGQLMYVLLLNGFDVVSGMFVDFEGILCGYVKKTATPLPPLRGDRGDISILGSHGLFPLPIRTSDGFNDGFFGKLRALNWPDTSVLGIPRQRSKRARLVKTAAKVLPPGLRKKLSAGLIRLGNTLSTEERLDINPDVLTS